MFNNAQILDCFSGLIGFEDSENEEVPAVDEDLQASSSGLIVGGRLHPLLTQENLLAAAKHFERVSVKAFSATKNYQPGAIVKQGADIFQAKKFVAASVTVPVEGDNWRKTNLFSAYLRQQYQGSVLSLVSAIFTEKKLNEQGRTLLASSPVFTGSGPANVGITKTGKFRGLKITLKHADTVFILKHIALQLTQGQTLPIYIYHSAELDPIETFDVVHPDAVTYKWKKLDNDILLPYSNLDRRTGGAYYIGYYEDDLAGSAIERRDLPYAGYSANCGSCTNAVENDQYFNGWKKYVDIRSFYVNTEDLYEDFSIWDRDDEQFEPGKSYGLNLQFAINCDVSSALCLNAQVLTDALAQQLKVDLLQQMNFSLRNNSQAIEIAQMAATALDDRGDQGAKTPGELTRLTQAKKVVSLDLTAISKICLPCEKKKVKMSNVWRQ